MYKLIKKIFKRFKLFQNNGLIEDNSPKDIISNLSNILHDMACDAYYSGNEEASEELSKMSLQLSNLIPLVSNTPINKLKGD